MPSLTSLTEPPRQPMIMDREVTSGIAEQRMVVVRDYLNRLAKELDALQADTATMSGEIDMLRTENCILRAALQAEQVPFSSIGEHVQRTESLAESGGIIVPTAPPLTRPQATATAESTHEKRSRRPSANSEGSGPLRSPGPPSSPRRIQPHATIQFLLDSKEEEEGQQEECEEPKDYGVIETLRLRLQRVVDSPYFEVFVAAIIVLNTIFMGLQMQYDGFDIGYDIQFVGHDRQADAIWPVAKTMFEVTEPIFTLVFTAELLARAFVYRRGYFTQPSNWLDISIVLFGLFELIFPVSPVVNPMMARLFRLSKLARAARIATMSGVTDSLQLLLKSIGASYTLLCWTTLLLVLVQVIAGMLLNQVVNDFLTDPDQEPASQREVFAYYGTFTRAMITMFEVHLANWAPACRVLVENIGETYGYLFIVYRCMAGFAVLNVINAVFIQQTLKVAQQDQEIMIKQKHKEQERFTKALVDLFSAIDSSGDGYITWEEIEAVVDDPKLKLWMASLDIAPRDLEIIFKAIDVNGDNSITPEELILNAGRIRGSAKSLDIVQVLSQMKLIEGKVDRLSQTAGRLSQTAGRNHELEPAAGRHS